MMSYPKPLPIQNIQFDADRHGFMCALSRRESSSNLLLPHSDEINKNAAWNKNSIGFVGYFQFGEDALIDCGYYNPRIKNTDKYRSNDWTGSWTGKDNIKTFQDFRVSADIQIKAFNMWIDIQCYRARNLNINEFYGVCIDNVEITESGCIAAGHLKGPESVLEYLTSGGGVNGKDKFNTSVGNYIRELAHYDLETCCNRKIYITVKDNNSPVSDIAVKVESEYKAGKYYSKIGKITNTYTTNKDGKIPVIIRHPGAVVKVTVNGKSQTITQKADQIQSYTIDITGSIKATGTLSQPDTPKPRPVPNKSPQDQRNEQNLQQQAQQLSSSESLKDVTFNITIIESDTKKPITNMRYYLVYKGNSKEHRTNNQGIESNITATVGEDIEVCVAGKDSLQTVGNFTVSSSHEGKTINVSLPVESFKLKVIDTNKAVVKNSYFMIFYRGRKIVKKTNSQGFFSLKMLVGFVYGFGQTNGTELLKIRCLEGIGEQIIEINSSAKYTALSINIMRGIPGFNTKSQHVSSSSNSSKASQKNIETKKIESNTQKKGNPITSVVTSKPTSDTTRYHIYHNGKIKRQNANATGYAEFIYYDENGDKHNLGKSSYIKVSKLKAGNKVIAGTVYLIDQRKHTSYKKGNIGYKWKIVSDSKRYYLNGVTLAATLGTMMSYGYEEYIGSGWSNVKGQSVAPSRTHRNGEAGDFRYLGKKRAHINGPVHTTSSTFDLQANTRLVKHFKRFKFNTFYTGNKAANGVAKISGTSWAPNHHHHLHVGGHSYEVEDI